MPSSAAPMSDAGCFHKESPCDCGGSDCPECGNPPDREEPPMTTDTFTYACQHCGGTVNVERGADQPHDCGNLTIDMTSALIRHGNTVLVQMTREWSDGERWRISVDRARSASGYVSDRVIDGWIEAQAAAAKLAKAVHAHELAQQNAAGRLQAEWPRYPEGGDGA